MKNILVILCILGRLSLIAQLPEKPNILFILVDDLNDYSGTYDSHPQVSTPAIDSLSANGLTFLNAYANNPGCAPSRTSMLSGKSSLYTQVFVNGDYDGHFRDNFNAERNNEVVFTLPEILKDSGGYFTYAINKVFHSPQLNDYDNATEDPCAKGLSWNKMVNFDDDIELKAEMELHSFMDFFDFGAVPDELETQLVDYLVADSAIVFLNAVAEGSADICDRPFFLSVGFKRPHSDRYIPEHYFPDFYVNQPEAFEAPYLYNDPYNHFPFTGVAMPPQPPEGDYADFYAFEDGSVAQVMAESGDYKLPRQNYLDGLDDYPVADGALSSAEQLDVTIRSLDAGYVQAYLSAVAYIDHQIGRVIESVISQPELADNTIIILVSDHGYSLGEKNHYAKWALWECINRIPFIMSGPGIPVSKTNNTVTLLDLFPTLLDLTGTNEPLNPDGSPYLDGHSLLNMVSKPAKHLNRPALSIHKRGASTGSCYPHFSVRTERYHLINYRWNNDGSLGTSICDDSQIIYEKELYDIGIDREIDPEEWNNLADDPEYAGLIHYLTQFFPDSSLHNQAVYGVTVESKSLPCVAGPSNMVRLQPKIFSPEGNLVISGGDELDFRWTHSLGSDTMTTRVLNFDLSAIPSAVFSGHDHIFFYLEVLDPATGQLLAFDQRKVFIGSSADVSADFHVLTLDNIAYITEIELDPAVTSHQWDIDGVFRTATPVPAPYTPETPGLHYISLQANYGNDCSRQVTRNFSTASLEARQGQPELRLFPNPGNGVCWIETGGQVEQIRVMDLSGREQQVSWTEVADDIYRIQTNGLATGVYTVICKDETGINCAYWVVSGP